MLWFAEADKGLCRPLTHQKNYGRCCLWRPNFGAAIMIGDFQAAAPGRRPGRQRLERRLAAILGIDIMGYSALMERNEEETHDRVGDELERVRREVEKSHGRVFSFAGDGLMAEFPSAVEALKCSLRVQAEAGKRNAKLAAEERIIFRIGVNSGELVLQSGRTGGTAVISPPGSSRFPSPAESACPPLCSSRLGGSSQRNTNFSANAS